MPVYETTFEVQASADRVWDVLTRLDLYPEWNPQIPLASGEMRVGSKINLRLCMPGRPAMDVSATIEEFEFNQLVTWRGHVVAPWFFEGYRRFAIASIDGTRVRVTHVEDIHGLLGPLFSLAMGGPCESSHHALNEAIRVRAGPLEERDRSKLA